MITFNVLPACDTTASAMILAEASIAERTEPAADAAINAAVPCGSLHLFATMASKYLPHAGGAGAAYGATPTALVFCRRAAPTGASPK